MLTKIALLASIASEEPVADPAPPPPVEAPIWGAYTDETAELYEHEYVSMVWFSIKNEHYKKTYYDGNNNKKDIKETDAGSITSDYEKKMNELAKNIEKAVGKKFYIVFFDTEEFKDHAVEGLNCKVDTQSCVSVLKPMGGEDNEEDEEVVYTKPLDFDFEKLKDDAAAHDFVLNFVKDIESKDAAILEKYKFTPSFDDDEGEGEPPFPPEDEGFGSDEEQEVDM